MATRHHYRQAIREKVIALLLNQTGAEDRVFKTRPPPWKRDELPLLWISAPDEDVDPRSRNTAPRILKRMMLLTIEARLTLGASMNGIVLEQAEDLEDAADDLAVDIERVMHADPTLGKTVDDSLLHRTIKSVADDLSTPMFPVYRMLVAYQITYYSSAPEAEDVSLGDFRTADVKTSLGGIADPTEDISHIPTE